MSTFKFNDGDKLVLSIDGGDWETITFKSAGFVDITKATTAEVQVVLNQNAGLAAFVDESGGLVLATKSKGGHASLELDLGQSTAAAALGLAGLSGVRPGNGLEAARLLSQASAPFSLPITARMTVSVDGVETVVSFAAGITADAATAKEVVAVINGKVPALAREAKQNRVLLTSATVGAGSRLEVKPGPVDATHTDAAAVLGFVGLAAVSQPHAVGAARLACTGREPGLEAINLTAGPIEFHFPTGSRILPARGRLPLTAAAVAFEPLQRLIQQGSVRLNAI